MLYWGVMNKPIHFPCLQFTNKFEKLFDREIIETTQWISRSIETHAYESEAVSSKQFIDKWSEWKEEPSHSQLMIEHCEWRLLSLVSQVKCAMITCVLYGVNFAQFIQISQRLFTGVTKPSAMKKTVRGLVINSRNKKNQHHRAFISHLPSPRQWKNVPISDYGNFSLWLDVK